MPRSSAVEAIRFQISSLLEDGCAPQVNAATPDTCGQATLVPINFPYSYFIWQDWHCRQDVHAWRAEVDLGSPAAGRRNHIVWS